MKKEDLERAEALIKRYEFNIKTSLSAESVEEAKTKLIEEIKKPDFDIIDKTECIDEMGYYTEDGIQYSGCCGAVVYEDTDICSDCKEHV